MKCIRFSKIVFVMLVAHTCGIGNSISGQYAAWTVQDGTSDDDMAQSVSVDDAGVIFVAGQSRGDFGNTNQGETDALLCRYDSDGNLVWSSLLGSEMTEQSCYVAASLGNAYLGGATNGELAGQNLGGFDVFLSKYDAAGVPAWALQTGTSAGDECGGVASDAAGNVFLAGSTSGDFGGANLGDDDGFLVKFDANGAELWRRQFGTADSDQVSSVSTDMQGDILACGTTSGNFAGSSNGGLDGFVVKYDSTGNHLWSRQFGTPADEIVLGSQTDQDGNVVICGTTEGELAGTHQGATDAFVLKYDATGNLVWIHQFGTTQADSASAVWTDPANDVFVTGGTEGVFEGQTNGGMIDAFVGKIDASGQFLWISQFGSNDNESGSGIAGDVEGNIYCCGKTDGSVGGPPLGGWDLFLSKFLATETIVVDSVNVLRGILVSGGIYETTDSDDQYLKFNPGITINSNEPPVWIEFEFTLPSNNPQTALFKFESGANSPGLLQTIEVYSWWSGEYLQLDVRETSFGSDSTYVINLITNTFNYIEEGTGRVRVRAGWKAQGLLLLYPWEIRVDQIVWEVNEFSG